LLYYHQYVYINYSIDKYFYVYLMNDLENCNDFTENEIVRIGRDDILKSVKKIYSKKCDVNLSSLKHINISTIDEVNNLDNNINLDRKLDVINIVFVSILIILLIILIFKLYSKII
jgi:hypothetical protein